MFSWSSGWRQAGCSPEWLPEGLGQGWGHPWVLGQGWAELCLLALQPYAVQQLGAVAGVMITASHNRKEDNGYKVSEP